jgi:hypothetical protein
MMKKALLAALVIGAAATFPAQAQTKKEWVQRLMQTQQFSPNEIARSLVERPAQQLMSSVAPVIGSQVPADKREAVGKQVETAVRKYLDEALPLARAEALKLSPTMATAIEEKFNEDELKTIVTWLESATYKKAQQVAPEIQNSFGQKLVPVSAPAVDPKLKELEATVRAAVAPYLPAAAAPAPAGKSKAAKPKADKQ